jgi:hypothetical protein
MSVNIGIARTFTDIGVHRMVNRRRKPNSSDRLRKVMLPLYLDPPDAAALRALSKRTKIPQQTIMREGIAHILAKYKKVKS